MTMPTILAQPIRHRIAGFALAPLAAIWLACVPAMAQVKVDSAQQTDKQAQKEVADMMGISQSYISRLEKRIIGKLRDELQKMA